MRHFLTAVLVFASCVASRALEVASPDGRLVVTVEDDGGRALYSVTYDGRVMVERSSLGLRADIGDFSAALTQTGHASGKIDTTYVMRNAKASSIRYKANTLDIYYENAGKQRMTINFRVADNDVAFRYSFPMQGETACMVVESETTAFRLPEGTTTFISPQSDPMVGWKRTKPSYEEVFSADARMDTRSQYGRGYTFPCLFHVGDSGWVLVSETGTTGGYVGCHLSDYDPQTGYAIAFPMAGEANGIGTTSAGMALPGSTPWRTLTVADNLRPIAETTVAYDVVEPLYEPSEEYRPGRYTWSWLIWQDNSINYKDQVAFVDLAAEMGYEYCLVDNFWDATIGRERMAELSRYALGKGVGLLLWYNSNGFENDAPQTPKNRMNTVAARRREMAWLKSIGVKGIKVDFFGGDKQETMRLYEDILSDANDYGINVIFHGCTMPRGWERLYPNYAGSEAVLASENLVFSQGFCDQEAYNATLHPFIRNAAGCMEYGGTVLNKRLNRGNDGGTTRRTSDAFQLATSILYQNAVQNFALSPTNLTDAPAEAIEFMKAVPTTWDETLYIDGYPGRYVVLARRHGDTWYIAGVSAEQEPLKLKLDLPMLAKDQVVEIYADPAKLKSKTPGVIEKRDLKVKKPAEVPLTILPSSGFVIVAK